MRPLAVLLVLLAPSAVAADPLRDLVEQPKRFIGARVTVTVKLTGEVGPAADGYAELLVTADGVSLDRLKFRAAESLANQIPDTGATHEEPLPARLVGRVLGADAAGRGRYVVHVDEVQVLDVNGEVFDTLTPKAVTAKPVPVAMTPEPVPTSTPEVKPEPAAPAAEEPPSAAESSMLPLLAGGGVGVLAVGGLLFFIRRPGRAVARPVVPTIHIPPTPEPGDIGPLSVSDRLSRRAR